MEKIIRLQNDTIRSFRYYVLIPLLNIAVIGLMIFVFNPIAMIFEIFFLVIFNLLKVWMNLRKIILQNDCLILCGLLKEKILKAEITEIYCDSAIVIVTKDEKIRTPGYESFGFNYGPNYAPNYKIVEKLNEWLSQNR